MRVVTRKPAHDAEEFIVAALQRAVFRQKSEVPFPDQRGLIADRAQQRRQCRKAGWDPHLGLVAVGGAQRLDEAQLDAVLVAPGDQRDPRVGAERRIGVGLREAHPLVGEPVERRRPVTGLPGAAEIRVPAVVDNDEDYIRAMQTGHSGLLAHYPKSGRNPDPQQARAAAKSRQRDCLALISCCGLIGVAFTSTPNGARASQTALAMAAGGATAPPSPTPLTPSGLSGDGECW